MVRSSTGGLPAEPPEREGLGSSPTPATAPPTESTDRLRSALHVLGSVIAPTSLITALLIFFGRQHARHFFDYFGIDLSLLGLTTQDYLLRSIDALFVPLAAALSVALVVQWLHARFTAQFFSGPDGTKHLQQTTMVTAVIGLLLFVAGMVRIVFGFPPSFSLIFPLSLGSGTLLLLYASRLYRRAHRSLAVREGLNTVALFEATGAFFLVGLSLFWAAGNYSAAVGTSRASQFAQEFTTTLPRAILHSKEVLHLQAAGVHQTQCAGVASEPSFRYDGLRLMLRSGGQYFFLPDNWSTSDGVAIVIPEGDGMRIQLSMPPSAAPSLPRAEDADC